jgi:hypothetical protein
MVINASLNFKKAGWLSHSYDFLTKIFNLLNKGSGIVRAIISPNDFYCNFIL